MHYCITTHLPDAPTGSTICAATATSSNMLKLIVMPVLELCFGVKCGGSVTLLLQVFVVDSESARLLAGTYLLLWPLTSACS